MKTYAIAVRALCEFTAKSGDLDLRFTPAPTALEGQAGHATVAARRARDGYESEVSVSGEYKLLTVRGRADGYDRHSRTLEEVKTFRGDLARQPANHRVLHWTQAKVYGWLMCLKLQKDGLDLDEMNISLVYFDIASQREQVFTQACSAEELRSHFESHCERFLAWAEQEVAHRSQRDETLAALPFPHGHFRTGQRELAEAVYRATVQGRVLMAQAPTGIGKTVGTLFPMLKAMPGQQLDQVFFLTAKGSGRQLALEAAERLQSGQPARPILRTLELVARNKACEHPELACHGESCPLARGFYDRLADARAEALARPMLDKATVREVALAHQVCPYYLSQELARWADVIVGDYNYLLDIGGLLMGLTLARGSRVSVLIDEAHNLLERSRMMYSADLDQAALKAMRRTAPAALKSVLAKLNKAWNDWAKPQATQATPYQVYPAVPEAFSQALQKATSAITDHFTEYPTSAVDGELQRFYFDALHFSRVHELADENWLVDVTLQGPPGRKPLALITLRNVVPAPQLGPRLAVAHSVALFSATLTPREFYADLLGLPDDTVWVDVPTPFSAGQLEVRVARHISTRYQHRAASVEPIAGLIAEQYARRPGNYLAFFSSFDYLRQVLAAFRTLAPEVPVWEQSRGMSEPEREAFLARFVPEGRGVGFAVLGGSFGEGVDLPGDRLIGAFIATLGLPQLNPVNEEMKKRLDARFGPERGYDYAYLYPGLQKVVQAAGRVIRTTEDEGVIHLIDDRFTGPRVRRLLPAWWTIRQSEPQITNSSAL
ncbi:ATP-dependent DNA helicase [Piscinibacter sp. HJYY11]|uniref:ATP-dependent DNA helicase n=1 Tax=Piscinibacter sp. HJYY11 TaxID=2801333 RepID=UPI001F16B942|nr:ATP-dependent DNA helicase [Piscinibacter sp. HJYY11]